jgi:hypothetical protein
MPASIWEGSLSRKTWLVLSPFYLHGQQQEIKHRWQTSVSGVKVLKDLLFSIASSVRESSIQNPCNFLNRDLQTTYRLFWANWKGQYICKSYLAFSMKIWLNLYCHIFHNPLSKRIWCLQKWITKYINTCAGFK